MNDLAAQLRELIRTGQVLPGDGVVYRYAKPDFINRRIAGVQARALKNLGSPAGASSPLSSPGVSEPTKTPAGEPSKTEDIGRNDGMVEWWNGEVFVHPSASSFTHAGIVAGVESTVEMTSPRCRQCSWDTRMEDIAEVVVIRPAWSVVDLLKDAVKRAFCQVGTLYPFREILMYWFWSWGIFKLFRGNPFERVFKSHKRDVCSGSLVRWWMEVGLCHELQDLDRWPEAWYPGRLLVSPDKFQVVAVLVGHETHEQHEGKQENGQ